MFTCTIQISLHAPEGLFILSFTYETTIYTRSNQIQTIKRLKYFLTDTDTGDLYPGGQLYRQAGLCLSLYAIPSHGPASSVDGSSDTSSEADRDSSLEPSRLIREQYSGHLNSFDQSDSNPGSPASPRVSNTIRVYATCLRPHLAYKTIMITPATTSREVITGLLTRCLE